MKIEHIYVIIEELYCDEMMKCRAFSSLDDANACMEEWAEEKGISLDPDETDADISVENDEECDFNYITSIAHNDYGKIRLFAIELE